MLDKTKIFLFDLDGTIYIDSVLIGNVVNTLNVLREKGYVVGFLTNNSSTTSKTYVEKLTRLNVFKEGDFFYSSLDSACDYILDDKTVNKVYAVASEEVKLGIKEKGINLVDDKDYMEADTVLLTFDKTLNYQKIENANRLISIGKKYITTHPDNVCPAIGGFIPDLGAFTEMFYYSSNRYPDVICGKPFLTMAVNIAKKLNVKLENLCMVGDRLSTDIAFATNNGLTSILVLSGETSVEMAKDSKIKADYTLNNVDEILTLI